MKSQAMVLRHFQRPMEMTEFEIPALQPGQVLVRIDTAGVCGSDVHQFRGEDPRVPLPIILGHEGVGHIAGLSGKRFSVQGKQLKEGDRILWNRGYTCGRCISCAVDKEPSLCTNRRVYGINVGCEEQPHLNGCYSQYIILSPQTDIFDIDEEVPSEVLVTASCSGATVAHGFSMIENCLGKTVLIQGPGPLGIYSIMFARSLGASKIIVIGGSELRLGLCREFGATHILNRHEMTQEQRREAVMQLTNGRGVDLAVETAGTHGTAEEGLKLVRTGGTYLTMGYAQPAGMEQIDFYSDVVKRNLHLQGVWVSDSSHTYQAMELCKKNATLLEKLVTHKLPLSQANQAIDLMIQKKALKVVLKP